MLMKNRGIETCADKLCKREGGRMGFKVALRAAFLHQSFQ